MKKATKAPFKAKTEAETNLDEMANWRTPYHRPVKKEILLAGPKGKLFLDRGGRIKPVSLTFALGWWYRCEKSHEDTGDFNWNTSLLEVLRMAKKEIAKGGVK